MTAEHCETLSIWTFTLYHVRLLKTDYTLKEAVPPPWLTPAELGTTIPRYSSYVHCSIKVWKDSDPSSTFESCPETTLNH